jgi:hypothetical protein
MAGAAARGKGFVHGWPAIGDHIDSAPRVGGQTGKATGGMCYAQRMDFCRRRSIHCRYDGAPLTLTG